MAAECEPILSKSAKKRKTRQANLDSIRAIEHGVPGPSTKIETVDAPQDNFDTSSASSPMMINYEVRDSHPAVDETNVTSPAETPTGHQSLSWSWASDVETDIAAKMFVVHEEANNVEPTPNRAKIEVKVPKKKRKPKSKKSKKVTKVEPTPPNSPDKMTVGSEEKSTSSASAPLEDELTETGIDIHDESEVEENAATDRRTTDRTRHSKPAGKARNRRRKQKHRSAKIQSQKSLAAGTNLRRDIRIGIFVFSISLAFTVYYGYLYYTQISSPIHLDDDDEPIKPVLLLAFTILTPVFGSFLFQQVRSFQA